MIVSYISNKHTISPRPLVSHILLRKFWNVKLRLWLVKVMCSLEWIYPERLVTTIPYYFPWLSVTYRIHKNRYGCHTRHRINKPWQTTAVLIEIVLFCLEFLLCLFWYTVDRCLIIDLFMTWHCPFSINEFDCFYRIFRLWYFYLIFLSSFFLLKQVNIY